MPRSLSCSYGESAGYDMVSDKIENNTRRLAISKYYEQKVGSHTLSSVLPRSYKCYTYTAGGNWWSVW
jgi:hypothetical protein